MRETKSPHRALGAMIAAIEQPSVKPIEVIELLEALPEKEQATFRTALSSIGIGLEALKAIQRELPVQ